jgi:glutamate synthase domain-containing protein 3
MKNTGEKKKLLATRVNALGMTTRELNCKLREIVAGGSERIELHNMCGQRYIGTDLGAVQLDIYGTPGNDLGAFMDEATITVHGNAQDGCGNTMNAGKIIIHGNAGDTLGLSARGGKIFVKGNVGYRTGIHMKEYHEQKPVMVIGGTAQDFFGEYMAGGILVLLGLNLREGKHQKANFIGTGMHGGVIYVRGKVEHSQLGKELGTANLNEEDYNTLGEIVNEFAGYFRQDAQEILKCKFTKLYPLYLRPYGRLYAY